VRFLADMGLAQSTIAFLHAYGHDAVHLRDQELHRLGDDLIVQKALTERRIILTHDLDFSRIVAVSGTCLPSVITFRLADMRPIRVNAYLLEALDRFAEQLEAGALISINEQSKKCNLPGYMKQAQSQWRFTEFVRLRRQSSKVNLKSSINLPAEGWFQEVPRLRNSARLL